MESHVTVNVVEPGSSIPVPNTGAATMGGLSGYETGIVSVGLIIVVLALVTAIVTVIKKKKDHKVFQTNKGLRFSSRKRLIFGAIILLALCGAFGFAAMKLAEQRGEVFAAEDGAKPGASNPYGVFDNSLALSVSDINIDVEVDDKAAFAYTKSDVKVTTPTLVGYMLYMYADNSDLVNKKTGDKIESISVFEPSGDMSEPDDVFSAMFSQKLDENTWGYAIEKPKGADSDIWNGIATEDADFPSFIKYTDEATEANDTISVYFGTYVTPDLPYGTYEGSTINFVAIANFVEPDVAIRYVLDQGYFDEATEQDENAIGYSYICEDGVPAKEKTSQDGCEWMRVDGKYKEPFLGEGQMLSNDGWYLDGFGRIPRGEEGILRALNSGMIDASSGRTFSAYSEVIDYFTIIYDANGGHFLKTCGMPKEMMSTKGVIIECDEEEVSSVSLKYGLNDGMDNYYGLDYGVDRYGWYNDNGLALLGWSESPNATTPKYSDHERIQISPMLKGKTITLYAVWGERAENNQQ